MKYRIIVAGSRSINDYNLVKEVCLDAFETWRIIIVGDDYQLTPIELVSGNARGVDSLGERFAYEHGISVKLFPANWAIGKHAGILRNIEMAEYATHLILIWDGESRGSANMLNEARKRKLTIYEKVVREC